MKKLLALAATTPTEYVHLEERFELVRLAQVPDPEQAIRDHADDIVGILSNAGGIAVTRRMLEALPNVEIISQFGVGVDNIDLQAAKERHIVVTNTPDVLTDDTADTALSLLLAVSRRIVEADVFVRVGRWHSGAFPLGVSLGNKKVGIVGMGRIGQAIAKRCAAFGMTIFYHGPREKADISYTYYADLQQMAGHVDYLVLACPGGAETKHLVNAKILKALGPKGFVINIARGSVIDQDALLVALSNREIAGAGLDVYQNEPQVPEALISMDNVVLLPHIGSATQETRAKMGHLVVDNIFAHFEGKPLITPVG